MIPRHRTSVLPFHRLAAWIQASLLATSLVAAPALHPYACTSPCASQAVASPQHDGDHGRANAGLPPCHAPKDGKAGSGPCQCTDDCCSFQAQFVVPLEPADGAPPSTLQATAPPALPDESHRAPAARLLPFPTGPPPIA
ncbi:MAG TPA: hypothetical protein VFV33_11170 [Gemmatimonadaceae bacterium]|nr:hypothetical protein [Gemmatimonadaceae bacterium]